MVTKICECCGKEYKVKPCRANKTHYCSKQCASKGLQGENNVVCDECGKAFHMKPYQIKHYKRSLGIFCSYECVYKAKAKKYKGAGNHQYGLKGKLNASFTTEETLQRNHKNIDVMVYCPDHPYASKSGRVKKHRLIVEENYTLFDSKYFESINGRIVLKRSSLVHHLDGNHDNNVITNLIPCTAAEHMQYHPSIITERDEKGRIVKTTAVLKRGELLESPEVDNQQPSIDRNINEGSTTNSRVLTGSAEDSNTDTSSLPSNEEVKI